jgi:hypothetical protein
MITLELTTMEKIYFPRDNQVGETISIRGRNTTYETKIEEDESGRRYVSLPTKQKILVPETNVEEIAVYHGDELLFKGAIK